LKIEELKAFSSEEDDLELPVNLDVQLQEDSIDEQ